MEYVSHLLSHSRKKEIGEKRGRKTTLSLAIQLQFSQE